MKIYGPCQIILSDKNTKFTIGNTKVSTGNTKLTIAAKLPPLLVAKKPSRIRFSIKNFTVQILAKLY